MDDFTASSDGALSRKAIRRRTPNNGKWAVDPGWLHYSLLDGSSRLSDKWLQAMFLDYIEKLERSEFCNFGKGTGTTRRGRTDPPMQDVVGDLRPE